MITVRLKPDTTGMITVRLKPDTTGMITVAAEAGHYRNRSRSLQ
jgi:uncharacterized protein (DUF1778 family)